MAAGSCAVRAASSVVDAHRAGLSSRESSWLGENHLPQHSTLFWQPSLRPRGARLENHAIQAQHRDLYDTGVSACPAESSAMSHSGWAEASIQANYLRRARRSNGKASTITAASVTAPLTPESAAEASFGQDQEGGHLFCEQFCEEDFDVHPTVSIGLGGRTDENLFEATVKKAGSRLLGRRVVLRQLVGKRAQRWGRRAIEVWQKVRGGRESTLHPFMATVHGFIPSQAQSPLVLVHAFYGSYSLHQWLLRPDWLPSLEARLCLDPEEALKRIGDATTGGAQVSRRQRVTKMLLRDALIGVNYLHQRGLAHTNLKLQNMHVSAADKRLKLSVPGNAVDLPPAAPGQEQHRLARTNMMAFDIRCVGILMARLVLRELMRPDADAHFRAFLVKGHDPASLRESLLPLLSTPDGPYSSPGLQLLDREGGGGWHLLARLLAPRPAERISAADALRHPFLCGPKWRGEASLSMAAWMLGSMAVRITEEYVYNGSQKEKMRQLTAVLERLQQPDRRQAWSRHARGEWRLLYHTGRQVGMTLRKSPVTVRIGHVLLAINPETPPAGNPETAASTADFQASIDFVAMPGEEAWPLDKSGVAGRLLPGSRGVTCDEVPEGLLHSSGHVPGLRLRAGAMDMDLELDYLGKDPQYPQQVLKEVRRQLPAELFDLGLLHRVTYLDGRLLILRGVHGPALLFTRTARLSTPAFRVGAPEQTSSEH